MNGVWSYGLSEKGPFIFWHPKQGSWILGRFEGRDIGWYHKKGGDLSQGNWLVTAGQYSSSPNLPGSWVASDLSTFCPDSSELPESVQICGVITGQN